MNCRIRGASRPRDTVGKHEGRVGKGPRAGFGWKVGMINPHLLLHRLTSALIADLVVDDRFEGLERLRPGKESPGDEERGRPGHAEGAAVLVVLLDRLAMRPGIEALGEGAGVELKLRGDLQVGRRGKRALILENPIVILPELPLVVRAKGGFGGRLGFGMVGKREVAIDEPDLVAVGLLNLL